MEEKIVLNKVSYSYNGWDKKDRESQEALQDISFSVRDGELVSIVGPSGCGKSTLLDLISGLIKPTKGEILIGGKPVEGVSMDCGVVHQGYQLFPWRSVRKNVEFGLELRNVPEQERRRISDRLIKMVSLTGYEDAFPGRLSGGMKQRVAIVRALAYDPKVLLMDEPFAALDPRTREILQDELLNILNLEHPTILFVTHDIREAVSISNRVVVLTPSPGRVQEILEIPFPAEHRVEEVRNLPEFERLIRHLWEQYRLSGEPEESAALSAEL